ncbi:MAG: hypothetical protein TREMPRED_000471 [Tremellales sp. Tagirdzhanova-0007]|nr:MAG: hypothetical protein TREMPRED_000471 [Tremellales sp. Tagirdzhanova-0007]
MPTSTTPPILPSHSSDVFPALSSPLSLGLPASTSYFGGAQITRRSSPTSFSNTEERTTPNEKGDFASFNVARDSVDITPNLPDSSKSNKRSAVSATTIIPIWIALSSTVILYNKYLYSDLKFPFPIFITAYHLGGAAVGTRVLRATTNLMDGLDKINMTSEMYLKSILPIGVLFSGSLILSNTAYLTLSVSFIQMLKASTPVAILLISAACRIQAMNQRLASIVVLISVGCALAAYGELQFETFGFICQTSAVLFESSRLVMIQILLQGFKMDPLCSLHYYAPVCAIINACFIPFTEGLAPFRELLRIGPLIMLSNAAVAFALNVAAVFLIGTAGGLVLTLAGVFKDILLITSSYLFFGSAITPIQILGDPAPFSSGLSDGKSRWPLNPPSKRKSLPIESLEFYMAVCTPTPTSTLYSTSISSITTSYITSITVIGTPSPEVRTYFISSCLSSLPASIIGNLTNTTGPTVTEAVTLPSRDVLIDDILIGPTSVVVSDPAGNRNGSSLMGITSFTVTSDRKLGRDQADLVDAITSVKPMGRVTTVTPLWKLSGAIMSLRSSQVSFQSSATQPSVDPSSIIDHPPVVSAFPSSSTSDRFSIEIEGTVVVDAISSAHIAMGQRDLSPSPCLALKVITDTASHSLPKTSPRSLRHPEVIDPHANSPRPATQSRVQVISSNYAGAKNTASKTATFPTKFELLGHAETQPSSAKRDRTSSASTNLERERRRRNEDLSACASWTVLTSYLTTTFEASTTWTSSTITEFSATSMLVPTTTLYLSCETTMDAIPITTTLSSSSAVMLSITPASTTILSVNVAANTSTKAESVITLDEGEAFSVIPIRSNISTNTATHISAAASNFSGLSPLITSLNVTTFASSTVPTATLRTTTGFTASSTFTEITATSTSSDTISSVPSPYAVVTSQVVITTQTSTSLASSISSSSSETSSKSLLNSSAEAQSPSSSNKAASAGAIVGGLLGMFALVALLLFCIRMVLKRRRVRRTSELRSSWFYGGDVDEPVEEYRNETDMPRAHPESSFSAPPVTSVESSPLSRVVPDFLPLPIRHIRSGSSRFPETRSTIRKSDVAPEIPSVAHPIRDMTDSNSAAQFYPGGRKLNSFRVTSRTPPPRMFSSDTPAEMFHESPSLSVTSDTARGLN